jgi:hypothetical protein
MATLAPIAAPIAYESARRHTNAHPRLYVTSDARGNGIVSCGPIRSALRDWDLESATLNSDEPHLARAT